jgi:hypothetical protein
LCAVAGRMYVSTCLSTSERAPDGMVEGSGPAGGNGGGGGELDNRHAKRPRVVHAVAWTFAARAPRPRQRGHVPDHLPLAPYLARRTVLLDARPHRRHCLDHPRVS